MSRRAMPDGAGGWAFAVICILLSLAGAGGGQLIPQGADVGTLRFDAVLELSAPGARTHIVLFARYWVAPDHYTAAVAWVEPHTGGLNYACYPVSLVIQSDKNEFRLSHQVHHSVNSAFVKPLGRRGGFSHRFNSYDLDDIRFAESDALASRIYVRDLMSFDQGQGPRQDLKITEGRLEQGTRRDVVQVEVSVADARLESLSLSKEQGQLLKNVWYEYTRADGEWLLAKQKVELPPALISARVGGDGITVDWGDRQARLKEFPMPHHAEGRTVTIDYGSLRLGDRKLSVPIQVIVRRDTDGTVLRSARLFNFVRSRQNAAECKQEAERFAYLDTGEEKCRQMFIRYWLKDPADLSRADANDLRQLRATLEAYPTSEMVIGQRLRRINKLLEVDWLLGDAVALERHFDEYLAILIENKLEKMVLFGGQHVIEVTVRWGLLRVAGRMLEKWVDAATDVHDPNSIVAFSDAQIRRGVLWPIARLLEVSRTAAKEPGERFEVEALRYKALLRLVASVENAKQDPRNDFAIMQAGWVVSAVGMDHLSRMPSEGLKNAEESYATLDEPSQRQKVIITQIRNMKNTMEGQLSARKRRTMPVD